MTPALRRWTWATTAAVVATGGVFAWMAYGMTPADPFAAVNHPWQPATLHAHVLTAALWLVVFGALWPAHIVPNLRARAPARRRSGLAVLASAIAMASSGYLLQVSVDDTWRSAWCAAHLVASAVFVVLLIVHLLAGRRVATR